MTQGIKIDGTNYNVPLIGISRNFDFLDKYAERTESGDLQRELIGVYANYTLLFCTINDDALYQSLIDKLTEPVNFHDFVLPTTGGIFSFRGYISSVSDQITKIKTSTAKFSSLQCNFTAKKPFRVPT